MFIYDLAKESVSSFDFKRRKFFKEDNDITLEISRCGLATQSSFLSEKTCNFIKNKIENIIHSGDKEPIKLWEDKQGSDKRIYGFESVCPEILDLIDCQNLSEIGELYLGKPLKSFFVLAAKLSFKQGNLGSGGGWHRDSPFRHQYKTIIYLSDVTESHGPFEYILNSHTAFSKFKEIRHSPLGAQRYTTLSNQQNSKKRTILGAKGDALHVDTRGVHRGAPINYGSRYALTFYFWDTKIPKHFNKFLNGNGIALS